MTILARLFRALFSLLVAGVALAAVAAFLGFAVPLFDVLNHLQPAILAASLLGLLLVPPLLPFQPLRSLVLAMGATGFLASAVTVVPEAVSALMPRAAVPQSERPLYKLMTWNIHGDNEDMARAARMILMEDPDILAIQEYFTRQAEVLHPLLSARYPHSVHCAGGRRAYVALYARMPFTDLSEGACAYDDDPERTARVIGRFAGSGGASFTVVTTHLDWPLQLRPLFDRERSWRDRIDLTTLRQRQQLAALAGTITGLDGPIVLVGDLNATPWAYALRRFAATAGMTRHTLSLPTFPTRWYFRGWRETPPLLPLDHLFTRGGIEVHQVRAGDPAGSDHRPVTAWFSVTQVSL